jgi:hypothetical protein
MLNSFYMKFCELLVNPELLNNEEATLIKGLIENAFQRYNEEVLKTGFFVTIAGPQGFLSHSWNGVTKRMMWPTYESLTHSMTVYDEWLLDKRDIEAMIAKHWKCPADEVRPPHPCEELTFEEPKPKGTSADDTPATVADDATPADTPADAPPEAKPSVVSIDEGTDDVDIEDCVPRAKPTSKAKSRSRPNPKAKPTEPKEPKEPKQSKKNPRKESQKDDPPPSSPPPAPRLSVSFSPSPSPHPRPASPSFSPPPSQQLRLIGPKL